jgi:tRNA threonylcarbamoyladenosine biosynthesis protein TsaB
LLILSFDTATDVATACLTRDGQMLGQRATHGRSTSAQHLLFDVAALLSEARVETTDLEAIVVGSGPGTFTGLRIGLATGRALGFALQIPVRGVSTLDALLHGDGVDVACIDARRGEVFAAGTGIEPCVVKPEALAAKLLPGAVVAGDGAVRYREQLGAAAVPPDDSPLHVPWAANHAALIGRAGPPEPTYLRAPDADRVLTKGAAR